MEDANGGVDVASIGVVCYILRSRKVNVAELSKKLRSLSY